MFETVKTSNISSVNLSWISVVQLQATCGPSQRFQWPAEAFMKNIQTWNLLRTKWGYICLTELLVLDKVHLHKNSTFSVYRYCFCLIHIFSDQIRRYGPPLTLHWSICLVNICVFSMPWRSLSWRVHLAQRTQYHQMNLSIYPLHTAISMWPSSQIKCPSLQ